MQQIMTILPEDELIICCARNHLNQEMIVRIQSLVQSNIDWVHVIKMAQRHGLMPLLYKSLEVTCPESVPNTIMQDLRKNFYANERRNLFLTAELIKLLHVFGNESIYAVPFKGPSLAASVYGDLALRQFSDLDILIQRQHVLKARDMLVSLGFIQGVEFEENHAKSLLKYQYELTFSHKNGKIFVGLHWELVPRYLNCPLMSRYLWNQCRPIAGDSGLPLLPPDILLLMLCIHGTKDFWRQMIWVCDVAELVRVHKDLDWISVITLAENLGCQRMLFLGLYLAKDILGASCPDEIMQRIVGSPSVEKLAWQIKRALFDENDNGMPGIGNLLFYLRSKERLQDKIRYCQRLVTTISPRDWSFLPLPASLFFLYYLLRPVRLTSEYLFRLRKQS